MEVAAAPQWTREITWRQGHILPSVAVDALGLHHPEAAENTCVVVISHDCDLANDNLSVEADVEIIIGRVVPALDGNFALGKAPRTLHLDMMKDGELIVIELVATCKKSVPKSDLAAYLPDESIVLAPSGLKVLRNWLAIRYNRGAFPDAFVKQINAGKFSSKLSRRLEHHGKVISTIFFDVDDGAELNHADGSPFQLSIVLAFEPGDDPISSMDAADDAATAVESLFADKFFDEINERWSKIELRNCIAISEDELRVSKAKQLMQWRLEHLSFKDDDSQAAPINI